MRLYSIAHKLLVLCIIFRCGISEVSRPRNLDYLDVETMEYFLSAPNEDFDVAVLFYAQWCSNCHAFAPIWDKIAEIYKAGTEQSKLIMGLFDCEGSTAHAEICNRAGVKHYPTISFFSLSGQKFSLRKPRHGTQFGGNWKYGEAVYDWVKTMSALSQWHRLGWGKKLRSVFFGKRVKSKDKPLPLGIPGRKVAGPSSSAFGTGAVSSGSSSSKATPISSTETAELERKVKEYSDVAVRSSVMLDAVLFPLSTGEYILETDNGKNATDVFRLMTDTNGWNSTDSQDVVLKACSMEVALDYCSRLSTFLTNDWISKQEGLETITEEIVAAFSTFLNDAVPQSEPYCTLIEECILGNFAKEECRPNHCPFKDPAACRYLTSCLSPDIQAEYAAALALSLFGGTPDAKSVTESNDPSASSSSNKRGSGWGLAV